MRRHLHIFDFYQTIDNAATAVKDAIEPMFSDASMAAAISHGDPDSVQNTKWMQTARKVHCRRNNNHTALPLPGLHNTRALTCSATQACSNIFEFVLRKMLNQYHATCGVLQRCSGFRLIYLHYSSLQSKLEFKLASLSRLEDKIKQGELERGGLKDEARQKVPALFAMNLIYQHVVLQII